MAARKPASPRSRLFAFVIDAFVVFALYLAIAGVVGAEPVNGWLVVSGLFFVYHLAHLAWFEGATPGRRVNGIRVIDANGAAALPVTSCLIRTAMRTLPVAAMLVLISRGMASGKIVYYLTVFAIVEGPALFNDPTGTTIADNFANTMVVERKS